MDVAKGLETTRQPRRGHVDRIDPYRSTEHAIATWPSTASSVGVRRQSGSLVVCAPYGLSDLLGMVVRPNKEIVSRDVYQEKVQRWQRRWPRLRVISW